jgi:outer membrane protein OmpA-like peptidoglycan-associated protein/tetratricopeptide (TPR) repeat protein
MKTIIFILLAMSAISLTAQNSDIKKANSWFNLKEYKQAAIDFEKALKKTKKSDQQLYLHSRLGETYLLLREYVSAEDHFVKAQEKGADDVSFLLNFGRALLANNNPNKAMEIFRKALSIEPQNPDAKDAITRVEYNISATNQAESRFTPVRAEGWLNANSSQYSLNWYQGNLMFSSDREKPRERGRGKVAPSRFYNSRLTFDFETEKISFWAFPREFDQFETDEAFVHSAAYDNHSKTFYVTRCLVEANAVDNRCNIYAYHTLQNVGPTGKPIKQSFYSTSANYGHPTLSSDGNVMIFTSTQAGKSELYIAKKTGENSWTTPKLLSSVISSGKEETYPKLFRDSILFFSSNGHLGLGGLDIFYTLITVNGVGHAISENSDLDRLEFSKPVNLGAHINSGADDIALLLKPSAEGGFFISNRTVDGHNRNSIFSFEGQPHVFDEPGKSLLLSKPTEEKPVIAAAKPTEKPTDKPTDKPAAKPTDKPTAKPADDRNDAELAQLNNENKRLKSEIDRLNEQLEKAKRNEPVLATITDNNKVIEKMVGLYFFDFDKDVLRAKSKERLQTLIEMMKKEPGLRVEIEGHTDNVGGAAYNQKLSENRAKAVQDFLIKNGIDANRTKCVGYGMSKPYEYNNSASERAINRRVEIKFIK